MADGTRLNAGTGGDLIHNEEIGSSKYSATKIYTGAAGVNGGPVSAANPLTVALTSSQISALTPPTPPTTVTANIGTIATLATAANQATGNTSLSSIDGKIVAVNTGAVTVASSALPTGASTATLQTTGNTSLSAIAASVSGVINVRPASPTAVDYLPVRLTDGTSFYTASGGSGGGGGQQYAEDAAHASGDLGTFALAVRKDSATQLAGTDGDYSPLITDASGRLHVAIGGTVAVTGTFYQATQPVSIASPVPITDNGGSLTVDGTVTANAGTGTYAISAAALPLPTGAATAAKQPAIGTAGSASPDVITVQGVASMTAMKVDGTGGSFPVTDSGGSLTVDAPVASPVFVRLSDGTAAISTLPVSLASVPSHAVTNAGTFAVQATQAGTWTVTGAGGSFPVTDNSGSLTVDAPVGTPVFVRLSDGSSPLSPGIEWADGDAVAVTGAKGTGIFWHDGSAMRIVDTGHPLPVSMTIGAGTNNIGDVDVLTLPSLPTGTNSIGNLGTVATVTNLAQLGGTAIAMGTGARSSGTQRVTVATDDVILASQSGTWNVGTVTTVSTVTNLSQIGGQAVAMGTGARSAGTQRVTIATDDVVPSSQSGTWTVQPGNTANTTPWLVSQQAATTGGTGAPYSFLSTAAVQAASIKSSAGQVYGLHFFNTGATPVYLRLYNQSTSPASSDTANIVYRAMIPGNTAGAGFVVPIPNGNAFSSGIGIRVTNSVADNDTTALAANAVIGNVFYK